MRLRHVVGRRPGSREHHHYYRPFEPSQFAFNTTDELEPFLGVLGQERAVEALQFGVAMPRPGYNVYVMGEPGTGRFSFVRRYLKASLTTAACFVCFRSTTELRCSN